MTTARRPSFHAPWTGEPFHPEPPAVRQAQALSLPRPSHFPVTVPLALLAEYLAIHQLAPAGAREDGTLLVRRMETE